MVAANKVDNPKTIWVLLAELARYQSDDSKMTNRMKRLKREAAFHFRPINREQLEKATETDEEVFSDGSYLHLPPDEKGGQPVMQVSFDTKDGHRVFRVKAAILVEHDENVDGKSEKVHRGIGIRFDGPEGPKGKSNHDYSHAQWFSEFEKGKGKLPGCPDWLPEVHPAIPISAASAVDILCCALKSFYGAKSEPLKWLGKLVASNRDYTLLCHDTREKIKGWVQPI